MKIGYGIAVKESDDPYISMAEIAFTGAAEAAVPGSFLVDLIPILRYVPSWFPGAGFQKKAKRVREATDIMAEKPFRVVQEQVVQFQLYRAHKLLLIMILQKDGKATPSIATTLIERLPDEGDLQRSREETIAQDVIFISNSFVQIRTEPL